MIRLTDEEIRQELAKLPDADLFLPSAYKETSIEWNEFVAQAQLKRVVEWGDGECIEHPTCETTVLLRRECDECWQALLEEVKE